MLTNIHVCLDKEHRFRKWSPINVNKYSYRRRQGASFADGSGCISIYNACCETFIPKPPEKILNLVYLCHRLHILVTLQVSTCN